MQVGVADDHLFVLRPHQRLQLSETVEESQYLVPTWQEQPTQLLHKPLDGAARWLTPDGPTMRPLAARSSRIVKGHPEGFHEAFANLYADAAEAIAARRAGVDPDPLALHFPNADDGVLGVAFVDAVLASNDDGGAWTACAAVR